MMKLIRRLLVLFGGDPVCRPCFIRFTDCIGLCGENKKERIKSYING